MPPIPMMQLRSCFVVKPQAAVLSVAFSRSIAVLEHVRSNILFLLAIDQLWGASQAALPLVLIGSDVSQLAILSLEAFRLLLHVLWYCGSLFGQHLGQMWLGLVQQQAGRRYRSCRAHELPRAPPRQLLQMIGSYLEPADVAAARLVCKDWNANLSAQVKTVQLPAHLWQYTVSGQLVQLYKLLEVFRHLQDVKLMLLSNKPCDSWSVSRAMDTFRAHIPTLHKMELVSIMQPAHWRAVLCSMQCLSPQLTSLRFDNICWPPPETLHVITQFTALQQLDIRSPHFSRLEQQHLEAIGHLTQMRELSLQFRTVDGTISAPLSLNPLSTLVRLTQLNVEYLGLLELASAVQFCSPKALASLRSLVDLSVTLVPFSSLTSLQRLQELRNLTLQQPQPLTSTQCSTLAACQQLRSLSLGSIQWADIPKLAAMVHLQHLSLQLWQPARGSLPTVTAGQQLLQLRVLASLRTFRLKGQCEMTAEWLGVLAGHWSRLATLDLCCVLPNGTQGVEQFLGLRSLRVQPYKWDVWSSEAPVLLYPALLPPTLTALECLDVWCIDDVPVKGSQSCDTHITSSSSHSNSSSVGSMKHSSSYRALTGLFSSVGSNLCGLGLPSTGASSSSSSSGGNDSATVGGTNSSLFGTDVAATAAAAVVLGGVEFPAEQPQQPQSQQLLQHQLQRGGEGLVLRTPQLKRLILRSTSPFDKKLHMPDLSSCNQLEYLELHHSQFNQCHLQHIAASCPNSLRSLKLIAVDDGARIRASGLTILTKLSALNNLSVHAHERAINRNVRKAISSMSQLRSLTLLTSPDYPTNFARSLACLTQLTNLMILRVGLGYGALDALRRLGTHVTKALPHCTYQMLTENSDC